MRPAPATDETLHDDATLLDEGRHADLLARHVDDVRTHVAIGMWQRHHGEHLDEVVQRVLERLLRELRAGRRYTVPFGVVVRMVCRWAVLEWASEFAQERRRDGGAIDDTDTAAPPAPDAFGEVEAMMLFEDAIAPLPEGDREAARLAWIDGVPPAAIADRLGCSRNAVDQRLHRVRAHLRTVLLP
jgi:RNA polymerase sigma factor (sigma-70 family)